MKKELIILATILLLLPSRLYAEGLDVQAYADKSFVTVGEQLTLAIKISGDVSGSLPVPATPGHSGFDIVGSPFQSSSFSWINGKVSSSKTVKYTLVARSEGTHSIGGTELVFKGETFVSKPVQVIVKGGAAVDDEEEEEEALPAVSADPSGRVIVSASLNKNQAYAGEGVVYTFSFFRKIRLWETPQLYAPDFNDFWVEDIPKDNGAREVIIRSEKYLREDIKKILFPTRDGLLTIKGTTISVQVDPFEKPIVLTTEPLELEVLPLPLEPEEFSGAVGNFTIDALLDKDKVKEGEPLTVTVTVAGVGNIRAIRPPSYEESELLKGYEPKDSMDILTLNEIISGTKTFEYLFVPMDAGELKLPSFSMTYFDPDSEDYQRISTKEFPLTVLKGEGVTVSVAGGADSTSVDILKKKKLRPLRMKSDLDNWSPGSYLKGVPLGLIIISPLMFLAVIFFTGSPAGKGGGIKAFRNR